MKTKFVWFLLAVFTLTSMTAQQKVIRGTVTDGADVLPGVAIYIKGETSGTESDFDGNFTISAAEGDVLVFSFIGMDAKEVVVGTATVLDVVLEGDNLLDEVVVVAFGTQSKESFTGSAAVVGSEDLAMRPATSPIGAIEGKATGVQFLSASGQPGSSPSIVIRGVGTLNGSSTPLYIVDGVQFEGGLNTISQDDIESMTVLKDAASTSLYGSRAANGVVIITTKKGKKGSMRTNVSAQYGVITRGVPNYDYAKAGQYYELMWEAYKNTDELQGMDDPAAVASAQIFDRLGYNPFDVPNDQIVGTDGKLNPAANVIYEGLDWYDVLDRVGSRQSYSMNIASGSDRSSVFFSASYLDEDGYVIESDYQRVTSRLNADFNSTDWLTIGGSLNLSLSDSHGPASRGSSIANPFGFAKNIGSIYPVYVVDENGKSVVDANGDKQFDYGEGYPEYGILPRPIYQGRNAIAEVIYNEEITKVNNLGMRFYADFKLAEGLNAKVTYGQDIQDYINKSYENEEVGDGAPTGRYSETRFRRTVENFNQILNYSKGFEAHQFDVTLGHESFDRHYSSMSGIANTQTVDDIYEFDNFSAGDNVSGNSTDKTLEGYFARLNYNYDSKYFVSGSFRRDGTSVFGPDVRWGNFYSIGGSWRVDQEEFIKNSEVINRLKVRTSYGEVGNDNLGNYYIYQGLYEILSNGGDPGFFWETTGNANLTWETVENFDVAVEFGLFDGLIDGSVEYYKKTSSDLLYNVPIPLSEGLNVSPDNVGALYNSGYEFSLMGHLFRDSEFNWDLSLQASTLKNEITELPSPFVTGSKRWEEGRSSYDFFIYDYAGVDSENGDALYNHYEENIETGKFEPVLDDNGEQVQSNDWQEAGKTYVDASSVPDVIGSISSAMMYKGFRLDVLMTYGIGGSVLDYGYAAMMDASEYGSSLHPDLENAWRQPGDVTNVPRLENGDVDQSVSMSTRYLTDASYLALRNVSLSYDFGAKALSQMGVDRMNIFASGENLFLNSARTGLNPQYNLSGTPSGNDYNPSRVVSFGVNVSF